MTLAFLNRRALTAWSCALILAATGCGDGRPERVPVAGVVLIDGEPLTSGNIKFVPKDGRPSAGKIGPDGRFNLDLLRRQ